MAKKTKKAEVDLAFITPTQAVKIEQEIENLEIMLKNDRSGLYGSPKISDTAEFMKLIKEKRDILANHTPIKFRGQTSNKAYARAKELAKLIKDKLPSKKDYFMPYPKEDSSFDFERAVKQQVDFQTDQKTQAMVREYKRIMARIDPSDPTIRNIERLRD